MNEQGGAGGSPKCEYILENVRHKRRNITRFGVACTLRRLHTMLALFWEESKSEI
jgi:hypothetical protein